MSESNSTGRTSGVERTYGEKRPGHSAEKTNLSKGDSNSGANGELASAASSLYRNAVENKKTSGGDKALTER